MFKNDLESNTQQLTDIHSSYKSKVSKLEQDHAKKMAALCENQTLTNEQLCKALDQSSSFMNQLQVKEKRFTTLHLHLEPLSNFNKDSKANSKI